MQKPSVPAGKTAQASAPGATLEIIPQEPTRNSILTLAPKGFDLSQAAVEWLVNGGVVSSPGQYQLKASEFSRGDTIQARVKLQNGQIYSNSVQIKNTPPEISSIKWEPDIFKPGDTVGVEAAATDVDGDAVTLLYEWTRNGAPAGKGKNIEGSVKRGDVISVKITPFDGVDYGETVTRELEIRNSPPVIAEHADFSFDGSVYTYQVRASDPDGDPLTYSLETPFPGMTIDPSTGLLTWVVPKEFTGVRNVVVVVDDGNGGTARYSLKLTIRENERE